jgi:hypothetical protein
MNKEMIKLALVGLAAGFCLSAQEVSFDGKEIAMSKCSKDDGSMPAKKSSCNGKSGCNGPNGCNGGNSKGGCNGGKGGCNGPNGCSGSCSSTSQNASEDQSDAKTLEAKRKEAAQKVVQGE